MLYLLCLPLWLAKHFVCFILRSLPLWLAKHFVCFILRSLPLWLAKHFVCFILACLPLWLAKHFVCFILCCLPLWLAKHFVLYISFACLGGLLSTLCALFACGLLSTLCALYCVACLCGSLSTLLALYLFFLPFWLAFFLVACADGALWFKIQVYPRTHFMGQNYINRSRTKSMVFWWETASNWMIWVATYWWKFACICYFMFMFLFRGWSGHRTSWEICSDQICQCGDAQVW